MTNGLLAFSYQVQNIFQIANKMPELH